MYIDNFRRICSLSKRLLPIFLYFHNLGARCCSFFTLEKLFFFLKKKKYHSLVLCRPANDDFYKTIVSHPKSLIIDVVQLSLEPFTSEIHKKKFFSLLKMRIQHLFCSWNILCMIFFFLWFILFGFSNGSYNSHYIR